MKKLLSLTAATFAALAWVGCSQDGVVNEAPSVNQAIEFGTYLGRDAQTQTRVAEATLATIQQSAKGFGVYAYYTKDAEFSSATHKDPNFMKNQQVKWSTDKWTYSPVKYWPNNTGDKVTFLAYYPYESDATAIDDDGTTPLPFSINFTVKNGVADQSDLLYAETEYTDENNEVKKNENVDATKQTLNEKVTFKFKHALARIGFTVQGAIDQVAPGGENSNGLATGTTITVNKVMLSGAAHTYSNGTSTVSSTAAFYNSGVLNLYDGKWSGQSDGKQLFTLESGNFVDRDAATTGVQFVLKGDEVKTEQKLNNEDSYLMIIPQDFTSTDMYVYVEYTVTTKDTNVTGGESVITNYISTKASIKFEKGKAYTINLVLGMNSVDLDVSNDISWGDEQKKQVDLPANQE